MGATVYSSKLTVKTAHGRSIRTRTTASPRNVQIARALSASQRSATLPGQERAQREPMACVAQTSRSVGESRVFEPQQKMGMMLGHRRNIKSERRVLVEPA